MPQYSYNPEPDEGDLNSLTRGGDVTADSQVDDSATLFRGETTGLERSHRCQRSIAAEIYDELISRRNQIMDLSSSVLDEIPSILTEYLAAPGKEGDVYNPTKHEITEAAAELSRAKVLELLTDRAFDKKFGSTWRIPLGVKKDQPPPDDFVNIFALGIRTLISPEGKVPVNSKDIVYIFPEATKRYETSIDRRISEATHIGPESWQMAQFIFGNKVSPLAIFGLALHEGCENACLIKEHREKAQREKGQLVFAATAGSVDARRSLLDELARDHGFYGLGTAILAEVLSEKIPHKQDGSLKPLNQGIKYQQYFEFAKRLISDQKGKYPEFNALPAKAWSRAFGIGAIEYGRLYRQVLTATKILMTESKAKGSHEVQAIFHMAGAKEFLVEIACAGLQDLTVDKANNAVTLDRYLSETYLKHKLNNDLNFARASINAQAGRILLGINTIRECAKYLPDDLKQTYTEGANVVRDLLYTTVERRVNPILIERGLKPILAREVYSAYQNVIRPLQNEVERSYGEEVDSRIRDVIDDCLSGQLYLRFLISMGTHNRGDRRPIH